MKYIFEDISYIPYDKKKRKNNWIKYMYTNLQIKYSYRGRLKKEIPQKSIQRCELV